MQRFLVVLTMLSLVGCDAIRKLAGPEPDPWCVELIFFAQGYERWSIDSLVANVPADSLHILPDSLRALRRIPDAECGR